MARARLPRGLKQMRREIAPAQGVAELDAEESVGRVPGRAGIETLAEIGDHGRVTVQELRQNGEILIVDNSAHLMSYPAEAFGGEIADPLDVSLRAHREPLEVDEECICLGIE